MSVSDDGASDFSGFFFSPFADKRPTYLKINTCPTDSAREFGLWHRLPVVVLLHCETVLGEKSRAGTNSPLLEYIAGSVAIKLVAKRFSFFHNPLGIASDRINTCIFFGGRGNEHF